MSRTSTTERLLWRCSKCGRDFANKHQSHSCGLYDLGHHFQSKPREVRALFDALVREVRRCGPIKVLPEKTRIAFQVRMSFAQVTPKRGWLDGHVVLSRRVDHSFFRRIDSISPRNHVHHFRLVGLRDLTDDFRAFLAEAYAVGQQKHLPLNGAPPNNRLERSGVAASARQGKVR
jgi:hypothetical protein